MKIPVCSEDKDIVPFRIILEVTFELDFEMWRFNRLGVFSQERNSTLSISLMARDHRALARARGFKLIWPEKVEIW